MKKIIDIFNIGIENEELFKIALTHPSYSKENDLKYNYQRLEFLGDAVLKLAMSDILYNHYPDYNEGKLSNIRSFVVSDSTLANICNKIGLSKLILLAKHDEKQGLRYLESVCACTLEAIFGAYYLDGKFNLLRKFIEKTFLPYIEDTNKNFAKYNAKSILQEYIQANTKNLPIYKLTKDIGPANDKLFEVEVSYNEKVLAKGDGKSKKEAEQNAAYKACKKLGITK